MVQPEKRTLTLALTDIENAVLREASITYAACGPDGGLEIVLPGFESKTGVKDGVVYLEYRSGIPYLIVWGDRAQEDPTHTISLEKAATGARCPRDSRFDDDIEGCGSYNVTPGDDEGFHDCYDCGVFFQADGYAAEGKAIAQKLDIMEGNI